MVSCCPLPQMTKSPMTAEDIGLTTGFVVMVMMDLLGNSIVCLVVLLNKNMQTPMNYLLVHLAISDMAVAIFVSPQFIFSHAFTHPEGTMGMWLCKFITGRRFFWVSAVASSLFLVSIAFERYFAVIHPLNAKTKMTKKKVRIMALCCWMAALVWILPSIILIEYNSEKTVCDWQFSWKILQKIYQMGCIIVAGGVPIGMMSYLYSRVIYELWIKRSREDLGARQRAIVRSSRRVTKVVITITVFYSMCWIPNLVQLWAELGFREHRVSLLLVTLNSSVNPLLYTLQSEPFRKNLLNLFRSRKRKAARNIPRRAAVPKH